MVVYLYIRNRDCSHNARSTLKSVVVVQWPWRSQRRSLIAALLQAQPVDRARRFSSSELAGNSDVEEHRLVIALEMDVEMIHGVAAAGRALCNQRGAAVGWHQCQNGVGGIGGLAVEIDAGKVMQQHAAREDRDQNMRRLRLAVGIGHRARLDGVEGVA